MYTVVILSTQIIFPFIVFVYTVAMLLAESISIMSGKVTYSDAVLKVIICTVKRCSL